MAIGWLTILKTVPWAEVISNAPKLADGAKKLWNAASRKSASTEASAVDVPPTTDLPDIANLHARLVGLEKTVAEQRGQLLAASELITALAEQNTQLIKRVETSRQRLLVLAGVVLLLVLAAVFRQFRA
jgi:uncharacterized coiled-coil protein SlyX